MGETSESLKANEQDGLVDTSSSFTGSGGGKLQESGTAKDGDGSEGVSTYEGVTAGDFDDYAAMVQVRLDCLVASSCVLVFALFVCAGILAAQTFMNSLEWR